MEIALIQSSIAWEDRQENLRRYEELLGKVAGKAELAILPETFTTGFSMEPARLAEPAGGETVAALKAWSARFRLALAGSFIAEEGGKYFNRAFFIAPGQAFYYDKHHLFRMAGENEAYTPGARRLVLPYRGWNICLQVCYDLRFPVWSRNRSNEYDLLIYVANWPEARSAAWRPLLQARAIENLAFVCGVNRVGTDGKGFAYKGESVVYSPKGTIAADAGEYEENLCFCRLDKSELDRFRAKFPAWKDADNFTFMPE